MAADSVSPSAQTPDSLLTEKKSGNIEGLLILIADDNHTDRLILQAIVKRQGHQVVIAVDGIDAVHKFAEHRPDIVLLDALMPCMDGFQAAREIKKLAGEDLVPVIFLTSLSDAKSLANCLEAGGDDFLSKPYNQTILQAKINAFDRMRKMHRTLQIQRDQIAENNKHLLREQHVAKSVFDKVAHNGCLNAANIRHLISPLSIFNGDVLLACQKPSGDMHLLLGDFTGHGLAAAIGAMPLAELFYGMTTKGYSLVNIISEINQKLKTILPVGFFCCACMVELKFELNEIEIWIGGLPDGFLLSGDRLIKVKSNHLPLGILAAESFDSSTYRFEMAKGDRFYMWSDGIIESENGAGELYGEARLEKLVIGQIRAADLFTSIKSDVLEFSGSNGPTDDITMLELSMMAEDALGLDISEDVMASRQGPKHWALEYQLSNESLASFDPVPLLLQMVVEVPGLRAHSGQVFTIISELYNNALDHGVLSLDSGMKTNPDGFTRYYQLREQRCRQLEKADIRVRITHQGNGSGGLLTLRFEDSGSGFDYQTRLDNLASTAHSAVDSAHPYSGRGLSLLMGLCSRLQFEAPGNVVEADYEWRF